MWRHLLRGCDHQSRRPASADLCERIVAIAIAGTQHVGTIALPVLRTPAARPKDYIEKSWAEEQYTRGYYGGYFPPGVWTTLGDGLSKPCGRIHWAGADTAEVWNGYMDGAISSGERAAQEAIAAGVEVLQTPALMTA